jgi:anti-sigma factor RsiW
MSEAGKLNPHLDDAALWQWRDGELSEREMHATQSHLDRCESCRQRVAVLERFLGAMRKMHHAVQPALAEQMRLARALERQFVREELPGILVESSRRLVRWLAPAVAILAALFVLLRQEQTSSSSALANLLPETPESRLLLADTDEQFQQAIWDVALSLEENQQ